MSYRARRHYAHSDDAYAAAVVLETFGIRCGVVSTNVLGVHDGEVHEEWEVWADVWPSPAIQPPEARSVEPDEHDRGRSTQWDEEHEQRDY